MNEKYRVNEIANLLGVSQTTIYKKIAKMKGRLKPHRFKEKGILLFDDIALGIFRESISTADKEVIQISPSNVQDTRLEGIEKVLLALVEEVRKTKEENRALRLEISALQKSLEYKKTTEGENLSLSKFQNHRADPREIPNPKSQEKPDSPQELTFFEWLRTTVDDFLGGNYSAMRSNTDEKPVSEY